MFTACLITEILNDGPWIGFVTKISPHGLSVEKDSITIRVPIPLTEHNCKIHDRVRLIKTDSGYQVTKEN